MAKKSKIVIVDDHPILRKGLKAMINEFDDLEIVGESGSASHAVDLIESLGSEVDLIILDMSLPDRSGLDLIKDLKAMGCDAAYLFLSSHDEKVYAERILRAGGRGYVMKTKAQDCLIDAIRSLLGGGVFFSPEMTAKMMDVLAGGYSGSEVSRLSDRELEVYRAIGSGKTTREIAGMMGISVRTVDAHRTHIKEKLGLKDATELNFEAIRWVESLG